MIESASSTPQPSSTSQAGLVIPQSFDYTSLTAEIAQQTQTAAQRIRHLLQRTMLDILDTGRELLDVKEALPHGRFGPWLHAEFGWSDRTARHFMNVAQRFGPQRHLLRDCRVEATAAYLLAAPSVSEEALEEALARARNGECITGARVKEILQKRRVKPIWHSCGSARLPSERLLGQLLATLESFRRSWAPCRFALLAREVREFADSLEQKPRVVARSADRAAAG